MFRAFSFAEQGLFAVAPKSISAPAKNAIAAIDRFSHSAASIPHGALQDLTFESFITHR
jgi:hypothetical protein